MGFVAGQARSLGHRRMAESLFPGDLPVTNLAKLGGLGPEQLGNIRAVRVVTGSTRPLLKRLMLARQPDLLPLVVAGQAKLVRRQNKLDGFGPLLVRQMAIGTLDFSIRRVFIGRLLGPVAGCASKDIFAAVNIINQSGNRFPVLVRID